jgi:uncharacterized protein YcbK (DUF882 family)
MGDLSKHFDKSEMTCKCGCGELDMDKKFMSKLDLARDIAGTSFVVNSGYRCTSYNAQVGGKPDSAHTKGLAADIKTVGSRKRFKIHKGMVDAGFNRTGIGFDDEFIHVDLDDSKDQEVLWGY